MPRASAGLPCLDCCLCSPPGRHPAPCRAGWAPCALTARRPAPRLAYLAACTACRFILPPSPLRPFAWQGLCTTLGGLCILDAKQLGRILYGSGPWIQLTLVNVRLVNGNSRDECGLQARPCASARALGPSQPRASAARCCKAQPCPLDPVESNQLSGLACQAVFGTRPTHAWVPSALAAGGAVMLEDGGSLEATNCAFERNWGRYGGAIDVMVRCKWQGAGTSFGPSVPVRSAAVLVLTRLSSPPACPCSAPQNGSTVTITGASFYSNKAGITGGALRVQVCRGGCSSGSLPLAGCLISPSASQSSSTRVPALNF